MCEIKEYRIEEIAADLPNSMSTGPFGSAISAKYFQDHGVPVIRGGNLSADISCRISDEGLVFVSDQKASEFKRSIVRKGDLIFTCWGTINQVGIIDEGSRYSEYVISNKQMKLTVNPDIADPLYIYYLFSSPQKQSEILSNGIGAAVPGFNLGQLKNHVVHLPSIRKQRRVSFFLDSLDKKISHNKKTNQTLEKIAQALFKSWFVDFDPVKAKIAALKAGGGAEDAELAAMGVIAAKTPKELAELKQTKPETYQNLAQTAALFPSAMQESELGEIPEGWDVYVLSELVSLTGGGTPKRSESEFWGGDISWFSVRDVPEPGNVFVIDTEEKITDLGFKKSSTKLLPQGTTIITARGTVGKLALLAKPMCMNQSCYGVNGKSFGPFFNYYYLSQAVSTLKQNTHGAVFDTITTSTFDTYRSSYCGDELAQVFEEYITPLMNSIVGNLNNNKVLTEMRDHLLPRLLSGELGLCGEATA